MRIQDIKIIAWAIERLIPHARNARLHSEVQVAQIAASIAEFGFNNPILVGPQGDIIAGHARVLAARQLAYTLVPVIVLDHLTPAQQRALVLADNRLALNASWDEEILRAELAALEEIDFNIELIGFGHEKIINLATDGEKMLFIRVDGSPVNKTYSGPQQGQGGISAQLE